MNTLGIDPGLRGALALLDSDGKLVELIDMPTLAVTRSRRQLDTHELVGKLEDWHAFEGPFRVVLEQAIVMPGQGSSSGFKTGVGFGVVLGILAAQKIPHEAIPPQRWQKALFGKVDKGTAKDHAHAMASKLYPCADLGRRKSQDRSDALCIALYGHRVLWGTP